MPYRAARQCTFAGCPNPATHGSRCYDHATRWPTEAVKPRATSTERGYDAAWRKKRDAYLKEYPFCVTCWAWGREQYATEVDHVIPLSAGGADDPTNYQSLCHEHHSAKTMREINRRRLTK